MSAIVLLSGGLDSAVCLAQAVTKHERILAITFDYGQKAKEQELWAASQLTDYYQVKHQKIKIGLSSTNY